jgi:hypothetical protein
MDANNRFSTLKYKWLVNTQRKSPVVVAVFLPSRSVVADTGLGALSSPMSAARMRAMLFGIRIRARTAELPAVAETIRWREVAVVGMVRARRLLDAAVVIAEVH